LLSSLFSPLNFSKQNLKTVVDSTSGITVLVGLDVGLDVGLNVGLDVGLEVGLALRLEVGLVLDLKTHYFLQ